MAADPVHTTTSDRVVGEHALVRTAVGAVGGAVGGVGASIVLVQGGRIDVDWSWTVAWWPVVLGAAVGFVRPPTWLQRTLIAIVTIGAGFVFFGGATRADAAQDRSCSAYAEVDGRSVDLQRTSRSSPLVLDVDERRHVGFQVEADGVERGLVEVTVASVTPLGHVIDVGDTVVYYDELKAGTATGVIDVVPGPRGRYRIVGERWGTSAPAFGLLELQVVVVSMIDDGRVEACRFTVWARPVASPMGNALGRVGLGMTGLGAAAVMWAAIGKAPANGQSGRLDDVSSEPTRSARPQPRMREVHLVDADGQRLHDGEQLLVERDYRLILSLSPGVDESDEGRPKGEVSVRAEGAVVAPTISISLFGAPLGFDIRPVSSGKLEIEIEYRADDHVVMLGRVERDVAAEHRGDSSLDPPPATWPAPAAPQGTGGPS